MSQIRYIYQATHTECDAIKKYIKKIRSKTSSYHHHHDCKLKASLLRSPDLHKHPAVCYKFTLQPIDNIVMLANYEM